ncbi:MAG: putative rane protein [Cyanobacteria bacterium RYN_339]|nr:putative rane protein [Cyanobacteria bacterium RYN_339]
MYLNQAYYVFRTAMASFFADKAPRLGAALAYYSVFSMAPLLLIAVAIAGLVFGHDAAMGYVANALDDFVGRKNAVALQDMIQHARTPSTSLVSTISGVVMLVLGASGVFVQLKDALNTIWGIEPAPLGVWGTIRQTFFSVTAVLGTGFLLMVSLVISAVLAALNHYFGSILPGGEGLWNLVNQGVSLVVFAGLFALMFKYLPDAKVAWRDVAIGAIFTAVLFTVGKWALGLYIGMAGIATPFGAAGSLAVMLIWVYYSAQILFFGAELTKAYANRYGSHIEPIAGAKPLISITRVDAPTAAPLPSTPRDRLP